MVIDLIAYCEEVKAMCQLRQFQHCLGNPIFLFPVPLHRLSVRNSRYG